MLPVFREPKRARLSVNNSTIIVVVPIMLKSIFKMRVRGMGVHSSHKARMGLSTSSERSPMISPESVPILIKAMIFLVRVQIRAEAMATSPIKSAEEARLSDPAGECSRGIQ